MERAYVAVHSCEYRILLNRLVHILAPTKVYRSFVWSSQVSWASWTSWMSTMDFMDIHYGLRGLCKDFCMDFMDFSH
eukprot:2121718-Ditylum_brightwellii.AAC.1